MLRKFKIKLNGEEYYVEMEELTAPTTQTAPAAVVAPTPQPQPTPQAVPEQEEKPVPVSQPASAPTTSNTNQLVAPMPGKIIKLLIAEGATVTTNQPILILEAMKMENEIVADRDGKLTQFHVKAGQTVVAGDPLVTID